MGRSHYFTDRVRILRRVPRINKGVVSNEAEYVTVGMWVPARLRTPSGDSDQQEDPKIDMPIVYELVLAPYDEEGVEVRPLQYDRFEVRVSRATDTAGFVPELVSTHPKLRITGTIEEVRKRSKVYSYVIPVIADTEY